MDPISQGLTGAIFPQSISSPKEVGKVTLIGSLSGMSADLDVLVLIMSSKDPLIFFDYHRQFTHSLAFIPVGGFIMAVVFWLIFKRKMKFGKVFLYSTLGYATHGLLDTCTTYGTELLWPISNFRFSWDNVSIVDPIFTLLLMLFVIFALTKKSKLIARIGVLFCVSYLLLGLHQKATAKDYLLEIALIRGHDAEQVLVYPSIANMVIWRSVYLSDGKYHVDTIRLVPFSEPKFYSGGSVKRFVIEDEYPELDKNSVLYKDIMRFNRFTRGYLSREGKNKIGDPRYSSLPNGTMPLWIIEFDPAKPSEHVSYSSLMRSFRTEDLITCWKMIKGADIR